MGQNISKVTQNSGRKDFLDGRSIYRHVPPQTNAEGNPETQEQESHPNALSLRKYVDGAVIHWQVIGPAPLPTTRLEPNEPTTTPVTSSQTQQSEEEFFDALECDVDEDQPEEEFLASQKDNGPTNKIVDASICLSRRLTRSRTRSMRPLARPSRPLVSSLRQNTTKSKIRKRLRNRKVPGVHFASTCAFRKFDQDAAPMLINARRVRWKGLDASGKDTRPVEPRVRGHIEVRFQREGIDGLRREFLPGFAFPVRRGPGLESLTDTVIMLHGMNFEHCSERPQWIRFRITEEDPDTNELHDSKEFTKDFELKIWMEFTTQNPWQWDHLCLEYHRFLTAFDMAKQAQRERSERRTRKGKDWRAMILRREAESGDEVRRKLRAQSIRPVVELLWTDRDIYA